MTRRFSLPAAFVLPALCVVFAQANPLAQIKQAANDSRDAAEAKSEEVARQAEAGDEHHLRHGEMVNDNAKDEHAGHGEHHANHDNMHDDDDDNEVTIDHAVAVMFPTEGSTVRGTITFDQTDDGVKVTADITGLDPNATHGFHIHEFGDLSDPQGKATGGHYNPEGHDHALPGDSKRHAGDMGNLESDADGNANFIMTFDNISIFDDELNPIIGRGVIIHAAPDDGGQPTGNAGARIAQGVVGVANK